MTAQSYVPPNDYREQWRRYTRLQIQFFLALIGWVVLGQVPLYLFMAFGTYIPLLVFVGIWIPMFIVAMIRFTHWPCPRCGKWFSGTLAYNLGPMARKCYHCGLPKFATYDSNAPLVLFCSKCGTAVSDKLSLFCSKCGAAIANAGDTGLTPGTTRPPGIDSSAMQRD